MATLDIVDSTTSSLLGSSSSSGSTAGDSASTSTSLSLSSNAATGGRGDSVTIGSDDRSTANATYKNAGATNRQSAAQAASRAGAQLKEAISDLGALNRMGRAYANSQAQATEQKSVVGSFNDLFAKRAASTQSDALAELNGSEDSTPARGADVATNPTTSSMLLSQQLQRSAQQADARVGAAANRGESVRKAARVG